MTDSILLLLLLFGADRPTDYIQLSDSERNAITRIDKQFGAWEKTAKGERLDSYKRNHEAAIVNALTADNQTKYELFKRLIPFGVPIGETGLVVNREIKRYHATDKVIVKIKTTSPIIRPTDVADRIKASSPDEGKDGIILEIINPDVKPSEKLPVTITLRGNSNEKHVQKTVIPALKAGGKYEIRMAPERGEYLYFFDVVPLVAATKADKPANESGTPNSIPVPSKAVKSQDTVSRPGRVDGILSNSERDDNNLKMKLRWCAPGTFVMGSPKNEANRSDDEPEQEVTLTRGFWFAKYEVTQGEWQTVMGSTLTDQIAKTPGSKAAGIGPQFPMYLVNHTEAMEFCSKLTETEKAGGRLPESMVYRLPTEAEWEYACRAGTKTATAFGDSLSSMQANCSGQHPYGAAPRGSTKSSSAEVGSYPPNPWGLHDLHGNINEWCLDWRDVKLPGGKDPFVKASPFGLRVVRGGSWDRAAHECRSARHGWCSPSIRSQIIGFRVALAAEVK